MAIKDIYYYWILIIIFFALSLFGILHHEIWLDEAHHWLLARDSNSLKELLYNLRYDGHPPLWNILLYGIGKITHNPLGMQLLHICISTGAAAVFLFYSNFSKVLKALYLFGYYAFYEYNIISRNYSIILLFLFLAVHIILVHRKNYIYFALVLVLLANTHLFGFIISMGLLAYFSYAERYHFNLGNSLPAFAILLVGFSFCLYQMSSSTQSPFVHNIDFLKKAGVIATLFFKSFVPFPDFTLDHFWNTNVFFNYFKIPSFLFSILLVFLPFFLLLKKPITALFFYFCTTGIVCSIFMSTIASTRHFGMVFILLIVSIWLSTSEAENDWYLRFKPIRYLAKILHLPIEKVLLVFLLIQTISGITIFAIDLQRPFAEGKQVANYLKANGMAHHIILANFAPVPTISSYLDSKVYILHTHTYESYFNWADYYNITTNEELMLKEAYLFVHHTHKQAVLVLNMPLKTHANIRTKFVLLKEFKKGITNNETFYVYKVNPN